MQYDDIIIGAGSSGAVLTARLSEDPGRNVLLIEAGPDYADVDSTPNDLLNSHYISIVAHDWGLKADAVPERPIAFPRGKVTGGSSAVNGAVALRGLPSDYDAWAAAGNDEWSWERCLPYLRSIEDDRDMGGDLHGTGGPIPVIRYKDDELVPQQRAFLDACLAEGFPRVDDHNDPASTGAGPIPMNREGRVRVSTALGYLASARHRMNLTIRPRCLVNRVLLEEGRAVGLEVECGGELQRVYGNNIVLSAGAVMSPAILWRSGIGPRDELDALGIECLLDQPAVGANLADHPVAGIIFVPKEGVCSMENPLVQVFLRHTAPGSQHFNDMQLYLLNHFDLTEVPDLRAALGAPDIVFAFYSVLQKPYSRGSVSLVSADLHEPPHIDLRYHEDPEDMRRLKEGLRLAWKLARHSEIQQFYDDVLLLTEDTVNDDNALEEYIRASSTTLFHPVSTCKMGPSSDPGAVVDQHGRVYGVEGLRVADASVMPEIPSANTNFTCRMIGERVAEWMREEAPLSGGQAETVGAGARAGQ